MSKDKHARPIPHRSFFEKPPECRDAGVAPATRRLAPVLLSALGAVDGLVQDLDRRGEDFFRAGQDGLRGLNDDFTGRDDDLAEVAPQGLQPVRQPHPVVDKGVAAPLSDHS